MGGGRRMKTIKLSNKNFKLFKEFCEEWIDERNELIDECSDCGDYDQIGELVEHIIFDVYEKIKEVE